MWNVYWKSIGDNPYVSCRVLVLSVSAELCAVQNCCIGIKSPTQKICSYNNSVLHLLLQHSSKIFDKLRELIQASLSVITLGNNLDGVRVSVFISHISADICIR
jgi:vesicle coat complex subunit